MRRKLTLRPFFLLLFGDLLDVSFTYFLLFFFFLNDRGRDPGLVTFVVNTSSGTLTFSMSFTLPAVPIAFVELALFSFGSTTSDGRHGSELCCVVVLPRFVLLLVLRFFRGPESGFELEFIDPEPSVEC